MVTAGTCVFGVVAAFFVAVAAIPSARVRRSYVDDLVDTVEDASIAGDLVGVGVDCSDDSESIELAYIINKREVARDPLARSTQTAVNPGSFTQPNAHTRA